MSMINVVIIDNEELAAKELHYLLSKYDFIHICGIYTDPVEALANTMRIKPDAVFLDINMPLIDGIEFAKQLKKDQSSTEIIFVTAYDDYAVTAYEIEALDYITKPISPERINITICRLAKLIGVKKPAECEKEVFKVKMFGSFRIDKNDDQTMKWRTNKTKELLAFLLCNRRKSLSKYDIIMELFHDSDEKAYNSLYVTKYYLRKSLEDFGVPSDILAIHDDYTISISSGVCDYVDFTALPDNVTIDNANIQHIKHLLNLYNGSFLDSEDYTWASGLEEYLDRKYEMLTLATASYDQSLLKYAEAKSLLVKLLDINPLSEEGYTKLLDLFIETNNDVLYLRYFFKYKEMLYAEYQIAPKKHYLRHFEMIRRKSTQDDNL